MINPLDNQFRYYLKNYGISVLVDDTETTAFFRERTEVKETDGIDTKYLYTDIGIIHQGSLVEALGCKWLTLTKETNFNEIYDKSVIRKVQFDINFNFEGDIIPIPALVDTKKLDIDTGQYITLPTGRIIVTIQDNHSIQLGQRFIIMGSAWKVTSIDKSKDGLISLYCDKDLFGADDDIENEIADRWKYESQEPTEPVVIEGSDSINLYQQQTYSISVEVVWSVSNSNVSIVSQNSTSITLKGEALGNVVLTADDGTNTYTKDILVKNLF